MIYLKQYLFQHKGKVLLTVLLLLGQVVGTLLIPALLAELVDQGILAGNISVIWNTGVKMLAVTGLATACLLYTSDRIFPAALRYQLHRQVRFPVQRKNCRLFPSLSGQMIVNLQPDMQMSGRQRQRRVQSQPIGYRRASGHTAGQTDFRAHPSGVQKQENFQNQRQAQSGKQNPKREFTAEKTGGKQTGN